MRRSTATVLVFILATAAALGGCVGGDRPAGDPDEVVIRSYDVPEGIDAIRVSNYIERSLGPDENSRGTARVYPDGRLVVTAPASLQAGIADLIADMARSGPATPKTPPAAIAVRYWVILARPSGSETRMADSLRDDATAKAAIDEIVAAQGPMEFALLERLRLGAVEGQEAQIRGRRVEVGQRAIAAAGDGSLAEINLGVFGSRGRQNTLRTWARLDPGKIVVLGQAAFNPEGSDLPSGWRATDDMTAFFVIASERE